jgi:hypothetical protein
VILCDIVGMFIILLFFACSAHYQCRNSKLIVVVVDVCRKIGYADLRRP